MDADGGQLVTGWRVRGPPWKPLASLRLGSATAWRLPLGATVVAGAGTEAASG